MTKPVRGAEQSSYNFTPRFRSNAIGEISKLLCERSEKSLMKSYDQILLDLNKIAETERSFKDVNECEWMPSEKSVKQNFD